MIIKEAAEFLTQVTNIDVNPSQLIDQLKIKFPAQKWGINSEVPESFVEEIENLAAQNQQQAPGIQKADPVNTIEAIKDSQNATKLINQSIWQALQNEQITLTIEQAIADTLEIFDIYDTTQYQLLNHIAQTRIAGAQLQAQDIRANSQSLLIKNALERGACLGEWVKLGEEAQHRKKEAAKFLSSLQGAITSSLN